MTILRIRRKKKVSKAKANGFPAVSKLESWRRELKDLADIYSGLELEQVRLRTTTKYQTVFKELDELETRKEELKIKIQTIARSRAKQGQSVSLLDLPYISVHVNGNESARQFDLAKAMKYWSEDVLEQVLVVDPKKVEALIAQSLDEFPETLALKAVLPREAKTPAVYIKVKATG